MRWDAFETACPEIATLAVQRFAKDELVMLGTIRADGSPRISPCEVDIAEGHLLIGMMWRSKKALDLLRDPRCVVHSVTCDRMGTDGDLKLYGRMTDVQGLRSLVGPTVARFKALRYRSSTSLSSICSHLTSSKRGTLMFGDEHHALAWTPGRGLRRLSLG